MKKYAYEIEFSSLSGLTTKRYASAPNMQGAIKRANTLMTGIKKEHKETSRKFVRVIGIYELGEID